MDLEPLKVGSVICIKDKHSAQPGAAAEPKSKNGRLKVSALSAESDANLLSPFQVSL